MPIFAYILIFIALGLIAYGMIIKAGGISKVPLYHPDPKVTIREDDLVRFASKNIVLIGIIDLIVAVGMMMTSEDLEFDLVIFVATLLFTGFIFLAIKYAAKALEVK